MCCIFQIASSCNAANCSTSPRPTYVILPKPVTSSTIPPNDNNYLPKNNLPHSSYITQACMTTTTTYDHHRHHSLHQQQQHQQQDQPLNLTNSPQSSPCLSPHPSSRPSPIPTRAVHSAPSSPTSEHPSQHQSSPLLVAGTRNTVLQLPAEEPLDLKLNMLPNKELFNQVVDEVFMREKTRMAGGGSPRPVLPEPPPPMQNLNYIRVPDKSNRVNNNNSEDIVHVSNNSPLTLQEGTSNHRKRQGTPQLLISSAVRNTDLSQTSRAVDGYKYIDATASNIRRKLHNNSPTVANKARRTLNSPLHSRVNNTVKAGVNMKECVIVTGTDTVTLSTKRIPDSTSEQQAKEKSATVGKNGRTAAGDLNVVTSTITTKAAGLTGIYSNNGSSSGNSSINSASIIDNTRARNMLKRLPEVTVVAQPTNTPPNNNSNAPNSRQQLLNHHEMANSSKVRRMSPALGGVGSGIPVGGGGVVVTTAAAAGNNTSSSSLAAGHLQQSQAAALAQQAKESAKKNRKTAEQNAAAAAAFHAQVEDAIKSSLNREDDHAQLAFENKMFQEFIMSSSKAVGSSADNKNRHLYAINSIGSNLTTSAATTTTTTSSSSSGSGGSSSNSKTVVSDSKTKEGDVRIPQHTIGSTMKTSEGDKIGGTFLDPERNIHRSVSRNKYSDSYVNTSASNISLNNSTSGLIMPATSLSTGKFKESLESDASKNLATSFTNEARKRKPGDLGKDHSNKKVTIL